MNRKLLYLLANSLWVILCLRRAISFRKSIAKIKSAQEKILFRILSQNSKTEFGKKYGFSSIKDVSDFSARIPISTYDSYLPYIELICKGKEAILTNESVLMLAPSGGSVAPSKYIPYTKGLKKDFQKGISPWIFDLFTQRKKLLFGNAYWSITPINQKSSKTESKIPIGFEEDSEYFGSLEQSLFSFISVVPKEVCEIRDIEAFRYATLLFLLMNRNLAFISIWNPTFLTLLLSPLLDWADSLVKDIQSGTISVEIELLLKERLFRRFSKNIKRAKELRIIFNQWKAHLGTEYSIYEKIWPNLTLISCWTDGSASHYIKELKMLFPNVEIQGKGLIATEGFISFPLIGEIGSVLSIESHFFEFLETNEDSTNVIQLAHQLELGKHYSVIITTSGGFYRYRLQDIIEVVGFKKQCPLVRFIKKEDKILDLFGEKLNEHHIFSVLVDLFKKYSISPSFFMVAPEKNEEKYFYTLFVQLREKVTYQKLYELVFKFEEHLKENYHYRYCRELGQLSKSKLFIINSGSIDTYLTICQSLGQRAGDIKPVALHSKIGWSKEFDGFFLEYRKSDKRVEILSEEITPA